MEIKRFLPKCARYNIRKSGRKVTLQVKKLLANKHFFRVYKLQQPLDTQEEDSISA
jgi:hypothetical protein